MRELAEREGIDLAASYAYSDSESDLPMLRAVGQPVVVNPDAELRRIAARGGLGGAPPRPPRAAAEGARGARRAWRRSAALGARAARARTHVAARAGARAHRLRGADVRHETQGKIRVVVAKPGLDGHDRGAKIIARALRDAGMEVIYTGLHQTPEQIVETVIQEDADAVGLSILSGAHMTLVPRVVELLREQGIDDVVVTVGGTIPAEDIPELKELGVAEVFTPGAPTQAIVDFIRGADRRSAH